MDERETTKTERQTARIAEGTDQPRPHTDLPFFDIDSEVLGHDARIRQRVRPAQQNTHKKDTDERLSDSVRCRASSEVQASASERKNERTLGQQGICGMGCIDSSAHHNKRPPAGKRALKREQHAHSMSALWQSGSGSAASMCTIASAAANKTTGENMRGKAQPEQRNEQ